MVVCRHTYHMPGTPGSSGDTITACCFTTRHGVGQKERVTADKLCFDAVQAHIVAGRLEVLSWDGAPLIHMEVGLGHDFYGPQFAINNHALLRFCECLSGREVLKDQSVHP